MKKLPMTLKQRDRERGAVAIVIGVMWTALFGLAVMAIDFGYLYTKKRNLQSVADAVLKATMPLYASNGLNTQTQDRATKTAHLSGYDDDGGVTTTVQLTPNAGPPDQLTVTIARKHPTFFGGVFGLRPRSITASAVGEVIAGAGGAGIQALANGSCLPPNTWGAGFFAQGGPGAVLTVNGSIESNTQVVLASAGGTITGSVKSPCTVPLDPSNFNPGGVTLAGGQTQVAMGSITDSIGATLASLDPFCTGGSSVYTTVGTAAMTWTNTGGPTGCDTPTPGVYCSSGNINVSPSGSLKICPGSRATFISQGQITFGASDAIELQAAPGAPNNLLAASFGNMGAAGCSGGFDLFMGSAGTYNLQGNLYAPNGCIAFGGAGSANGFTMVGKMVAQNLDLQMSPSHPWVITASGGGGGGTWKMVR